MISKIILQKAIDDKRPIQIIYTDAEQKITQRFVTVYSFNENHLIGYCHFKKQRRIFKIENILSAGTPKSKFA